MTYGMTNHDSYLSANILDDLFFSWFSFDLDVVGLGQLFNCLVWASCSAQQPRLDRTSPFWTKYVIKQPHLKKIDSVAFETPIHTLDGEACTKNPPLSRPATRTHRSRRLSNEPRNGSKMSPNTTWDCGHTFRR